MDYGVEGLYGFHGRGLQKSVKDQTLLRAAGRFSAPNISSDGEAEIDSTGAPPYVRE